MKDDNRRQTLGEFTGVHFADLNSSSYDINNIVKFDLNISTKVRFHENNQSSQFKNQDNYSFSSKSFALNFSKGIHLHMHRN